MADRGPWRADINYLYYNPQFAETKTRRVRRHRLRKFPPRLAFAMLRCKSCWVLGQNFGRVEADLEQSRGYPDAGSRPDDTGKGRMSASGLWAKCVEERSSLKGKLLGGKIDETAAFFGITIPLKGAPYDVDFDLYWHGAPWQPQVNTLSGALQVKMCGRSTSMGGGRAGQLLRLVSFDALLRKLQFDFSDTFGKGFYFDSIRSTARLKDGIMHTDNLLIDGPAADIASEWPDRSGAPPHRYGGGGGAGDFGDCRRGHGVCRQPDRRCGGICRLAGAGAAVEQDFADSLPYQRRSRPAEDQ